MLLDWDHKAAVENNLRRKKHRKREKSMSATKTQRFSEKWRKLLRITQLIRSNSRFIVVIIEFVEYRPDER
ncbi:unnamed protein product [Caenorhabditis brenneri]